MDLNEMQQTYRKAASILGDYQHISKSDLANGYCDAEEAASKAKEAGNEFEYTKQESLRNAYFSALMLRYWYKIFEWKQNSSSLHLDDADFHWWLSDALKVTFDYKSWRDPNNKLYNDPNGPDKVINRVCFSVRGREYQYYNKLKRKGNVTAYSLDQSMEDGGDSALEYAGGVNNEPMFDGTDDVIKMFVDKNKFLEAIVVDGIAHYDSIATRKATDDEGVVTEHSSFDARKLVKHLNSITPEFVSDFCEKYEVETLNTDSIYTSLKKMTNTKLYKLIKKTTIEIQNNPGMIDALKA